MIIEGAARLHSLPTVARAGCYQGLSHGQLGPMSLSHHRLLPCGVCINRELDGKWKRPEANQALQYEMQCPQGLGNHCTKRLPLFFPISVGKRKVIDSVLDLLVALGDLSPASQNPSPSPTVLLHSPASWSLTRVTSASWAPSLPSWATLRTPS